MRGENKREKRGKKEKNGIEIRNGKLFSREAMEKYAGAPVRLPRCQRRGGDRGPCNQENHKNWGAREF